MSTLNPILNADKLSIFYGDNEAVKSMSLPIYCHQWTFRLWQEHVLALP